MRRFIIYFDKFAKFKLYKKFKELHMLLEEAYNYKTIKKDKNGLSGAFKVSHR
jgi:hypothetical protein